MRSLEEAPTGGSRASEGSPQPCFEPPAKPKIRPFTLTFSG